MGIEFLNTDEQISDFINETKSERSAEYGTLCEASNERDSFIDLVKAFGDVSINEFNYQNKLSQEQKDKILKAAVVHYADMIDYLKGIVL